MTLSTEILAQVKTLLKGERLTLRQRQILAELAADTATLYANTASGAWDAKRQLRQRKQLDAQVLTLKSIGAAKAARIYWKAVDLALSVVFKAIVPDMMELLYTIPAFLIGLLVGAEIMALAWGKSIRDRESRRQR